MFGSTFGNTNQNQSPFGTQQAKPNTGFFSQTTTSPFGQSTSSPFGQPQNTSPFGQNTGGQGMFSGQTQQTQQGGGFFGQSNPNQGGGIFGQSTPQTNTPGLFGGQQQTGNAGLFGSQQPPTSNAFGGQQQGNQGGLFGQASQPAQQGGLFGMQSTNTGGQTGMNPQGQGLFGGSNNTQGVGVGGGGLFGQPNLNTATTSPFGGAASNSNQSFLGSQGSSFQGSSNLFGGSNPNQGGGMFGNTQPTTSPFGAPTQSSNLFGGNTQQQPQPNTGGNPLFGTFANPTPNTTSNVFGAPAATTTMFGGQNQPQQSFGQAQNAFNPTTSINNKLGGTSWGVPTNPIGGAQAGPMQPIRSKNTKLDAKHLVKCIAALDQFQGLCKEQLRVNFIQTGGQQPTLSQQPVAGFKPLGQTTNTSSIPSLPSFGGSQNLGAPGASNLFGGGQAAQQPSLFAKPVGNTPAVGAFGAPQQTSSLFGAPTQNMGAQQPNSLFSTGQTSSFLQPNTQQQQPQQTSLFGANPVSNPAPTTSLFGQPAAQGSLFNATPLQAPPSLFNAGQAQPQQTSSLFGPTPAVSSSMFGQPAPQAANFAQALGSAVTASTSAFTPNSYNPNTAFGQTPTSFNPMAPPLYPTPPGQTDQSLQMFLPQLLNYMLTQNQQPSETTTGNQTLDALNKLVLALNQNKPNSQQSTSTNNLLNPTPFDEYLKEQTNQKWPARPSEKYSLFSDAEVRQFQEIDSKSFARHNQFYDNSEPQRISQSYKPITKKPDPFGETNLRVVNRQYKGAQQQTKRKYTPTNEQLPEIGNFSIYPTLDRLKNMTVAQIKKLDHVKISNNFGAVQFLQPISLYKVDLSKAIKIAQDNIQIIDPELEQKKLRITFNNFGQYTKLISEDQRRLVRRMKQWIDSRGMIEISHDSQTGDLVVETQE